uniref:Uncharacterized protein n=1 Tax=Ficus carica TaxID=3494 RepID=A0AA88CQG9_FICCA|nr:hypothetical protein TIFTF001_047851 [Ficus carica]GMN27025.1 hypothetical protein TIFTF001_047855 [Ficus carica]
MRWGEVKRHLALQRGSLSSVASSPSRLPEGFGHQRIVAAIGK